MRTPPPFGPTAESALMAYMPEPQRADAIRFERAFAQVYYSGTEYSRNRRNMLDPQLESDHTIPTRNGRDQLTPTGVIAIAGYWNFISGLGPSLLERGSILWA